VRLRLKNLGLKSGIEILPTPPHMKSLAHALNNSSSELLVAVTKPWLPTGEASVSDFHRERLLRLQALKDAGLLRQSKRWCLQYDDSRTREEPSTGSPSNGSRRLRRHLSSSAA
jgi:hypothetical protein